MNVKNIIKKLFKIGKKETTLLSENHSKNLLTKGVKMLTKDVKPGYKTTEFWVTLLSTVASISASLADVMPPKIGFILASISTTAYAISRGFSKR